MSGLDESVEAVVIFEDGKIDRELQYPEFEAVMDGFVPLPDFANRRICAVYLRINRQLRIRACVFFMVDFDARGMIGARWNVPLQQLADSASRGPDLGAGPIALACYSQCPIEWHQKNLWDPTMEPGRNSFVLMKKAIAANRLGLVFSAPEKPAEEPVSAGASELKDKLEREYAQAMRTRLAHTLKEQRLRINTLKSRLSLKVDALKREHQERLSGYQGKLEREQAENAQQQKRISELEHELALRDSKLQGVREYYEHKLSATRLDGGAQLEALEEGFARELEQKLQETRDELQQLLDMREMELFYRQQQEESLREELAQLQQEREGLLEHGARQMLAPLQKAGISFVAYQPGAGQMTLPAEDIADYLADPAAYAAQKCGVSDAIYRLWLDHYQSPYCTATTADGEECGTGVKRITDPTDFHEGETNRCELHRTVDGNLAAGRG
ncbi:hypothetical protein [Gilvimarinus algae]|uniref:Chromosome partitioning protein ParA n=1 Tax=Gilvimarinus algae TaxID=3058037 RepID=A0ABT8TEI1_9GAMM|nr:hypothetical protein [Gilvimarinus sp. SDUM040014]MDO3382516.1 hypothetical protein [Gilvimarinus sp. SDUM040014]